MNYIPHSIVLLAAAVVLIGWVLVYAARKERDFWRSKGEGPKR